MPALGHAPARDLDGTLVEGRLQLEQQQRRFNVQDAWHDTPTLAGIWRLARPAKTPLATPSATNARQSGRVARRRAYRRRVPSTAPPTRRAAGLLLTLGGAGVALCAGESARPGRDRHSRDCRGAEPAGAIAVAGVGGAESGRTVGGRPSTADRATPAVARSGASGASLLSHPDSYAELGGVTFQTATAMGGMPYLTPLRVSWEGRAAVAYKRDFGLGGGPVDGLPRVIDLWRQFAGALRIPYDDGRWSGAARISHPPAGGAAACWPGAGGGHGGACRRLHGADSTGADSARRRVRGGPVRSSAAAASSAGGVAVDIRAAGSLLASGSGRPGHGTGRGKGIIAAGDQSWAGHTWWVGTAPR